MRKFQEILEGVKFDEIRTKCRDLFYNAYNEKFFITKIELYNLNLEATYNKLNVKIFNSFNHKYYKNFRELFDLLDKLNMRFTYNNDEIVIFIDDIDKFMTELDIIVNTKKYNL